MSQTREVLESRRAVRKRVWDGAPDPTGLDATADVRALRAQDTTVSDTNAARRSTRTGSNADSDTVGARLLAELGL